MERKYTTKIDTYVDIDVTGIPIRSSKNDSQVIGFNEFVENGKTDTYLDGGTVYVEWTVNFVNRKEGYEIEHSIDRVRALLEFVEAREDDDEDFEMKMDIDSSNREWAITVEGDTTFQIGSYISPQSIEIDLLKKKIVVSF